MKLLAIHSNAILLKKDTPNFYSWIATKRNLSKEYNDLMSQYEAVKEKKPLLLKETYNLTIGGLTQPELVNYCQQFNEIYFNNDIVNDLQKLIDQQVSILVFTSYPQELYQFLMDKNLITNVFGVEAFINEETGKIKKLKKIALKDTSAVKEKMKEIGYADNFTDEPNRYGLLELLIDEMLVNNLSKDEVVVLGKDTTAQPLHKVASKVIDNLLDLLRH